MCSYIFINYIFRLTCIDEEINEINELIEKNNIMEDRITDKNTKKNYDDYSNDIDVDSYIMIKDEFDKLK
jgi:hypothetical protein